MDESKRQRFDRQILFSGIGEEGQEKLLASKVVQVGCGGLGSTLAQCMGRAGIGKLTIVDKDHAEVTNLHRQFLFDMEDAESGVNKALAAKKILEKVDPDLEVAAIPEMLTEENADELLGGHDLVLDGLDNMDTRYLINDWCLKNGVPWIYGGVVAGCGMVLTILPGEGPCLKCLFPDPEACDYAPTIPTAGIINTLPAHIATIQATEAQKLLIGSPDLVLDLRIVDLWAGSVQRMPLKKSPSCPACKGCAQ